MSKTVTDLSEMMYFYHAAKEFFTSVNYKDSAEGFIRTLEKYTESAKAILILNTDEELTLFGGQETVSRTMSELISSLPLLIKSYACTRFDTTELAAVVNSIGLTGAESYIDGLHFSFELNSRVSICFVLLRSVEQGSYTEDEYKYVTTVSSFLDELVNFSINASHGRALSDQHLTEQSKQSVWLESLAWLNEVSNEEYTDAELRELYNVALFHLKILVRADSAVAFDFISSEEGESGALKRFISYEDNSLSDTMLNVIEKDTNFEGFNPGRHFNISQTNFKQLETIGIDSVLLYPLYVNDDLKMVLCVGRRNKAFDHDEEMIATLFSEGLEHLVERMFFLRSMREQNAYLYKEKLEQQKLIGKLQEAQEQLLQQEKMASIGQLAAGVAHEINNPVGYVNSNINSMESYITDLYKVLSIYEKIESKVPEEEESRGELRTLKDDIDYDFIRDDIKDLIDESKEGVLRVKQIVKDLKDFSHVDEAEWQVSDLEKGIDSTLNIVRNELKYKANITKDYAQIPPVECVPSQINQVIMNLLVNAGHAIDDQGEITIRTKLTDQDFVCVEIADNGKGIEKKHLTKIFDPFFTTKPVGEGTGLGLSLSYSIAEKHGGELSVESEERVGTTFCLTLPIKQGKSKVAE